MTDPIAPMEAKVADELPTGDGWQYEPKWDGFRCIAMRDGTEVVLWSKSGKPLARYFPEVAEMFASLSQRRFVLDGELLIAASDRVSFDALQMRLHPAASRVAKLAAETPALFMAFDCLELGRKNLSGKPLGERRAALEAMLRETRHPRLLLSPATTDRAVALGWLERSGRALDGVIAKRRDDPYRPGERAMIKVKRKRTADCVVGGFRYGKNSPQVASLLLGLYDDDGLLHHVGFTASLAAPDRKAWTGELTPLIEAPGFTGNAPGGPSRWSTDRSNAWEPLSPLLVVEVEYDQVTSGRFRHGARLVRRRPDKDPRQCTFEQLAPPLTPDDLSQLVKSSP